MKTTLIAALALFGLSGCAGMYPADRNAQKEFTSDFYVPGKTKIEIWRNARDFFSETYGDSRSVFRVMDEADGTLIGKALVSWSYAGNSCTTEYHIRFAAKDGKARLQLELIYGVPSLSTCSAWPWPSADGYAEIVRSFDRMAENTEVALKGSASTDKLKDF